MTVGRREILFADPRETERLIGRVLAGMVIFKTNISQLKVARSLNTVCYICHFEIRSIFRMWNAFVFISCVCVCRFNVT